MAESSVGRDDVARSVVGLECPVFQVVEDFHRAQVIWPLITHKPCGEPIRMDYADPIRREFACSFTSLYSTESLSAGDIIRDPRPKASLPEWLADTKIPFHLSGGVAVFRGKRPGLYSTWYVNFYRLLRSYSFFLRLEASVHVVDELGPLPGALYMSYSCVRMAAFAYKAMHAVNLTDSWT